MTTPIKFSYGQLSADAVEFAKKYQLDKDCNDALDETEKGRKVVDLINDLMTSGQLAQSEIRVANALLRAFQDPSASAPRNETAAEKLKLVIGTESDEIPTDKVSTKRIRSLDLATLENASLKERVKMVRAIVDDWFVFDNSEQAVLRILDSAPAHQKAILAELLLDEKYDDTTTLKDRIIYKLGGPDDVEENAAIEFFRKYYYDNVDDLSVTQRQSQIDKQARLPQSQVDEAMRQHLVELVTHTAAGDEKAMLALLNTKERFDKLMGVLGSGTCYQDEVRGWMLARVGMLDNQAAVLTMVQRVGVTEDAEATALVKALDKATNCNGRDVMAALINRGALNPRFSAVRAIAIENLIKGANTPADLLEAMNGLDKLYRQKLLANSRELGDFLTTLKGKRRDSFADEFLRRLEGQGGLKPLLPFLTYTPPTDIHELDKLVNGPQAEANRALAFRSDYSQWNSFSPTLPSGDVNERLTTEFTNTHSRGYVEEAFKKAEAAYLKAARDNAKQPLVDAIKAADVSGVIADLTARDETWPKGLIDETMWRNVKLAEGEAGIPLSKLQEIVSYAEEDKVWTSGERMALLRALYQLKFKGFRAAEYASQQASKVPTPPAENGPIGEIDDKMQKELDEAKKSNGSVDLDELKAIVLEQAWEQGAGNNGTLAKREINTLKKGLAESIFTAEAKVMAQKLVNLESPASLGITQPEIDDKMYADLEAAHDNPGNGITAPELRDIVRKQAWEQGNDGGLSRREIAALKKALAKDLFASDKAREIAQGLCKGNLPEVYGINPPEGSAAPAVKLDAEMWERLVVAAFYNKYGEYGGMGITKPELEAIIEELTAAGARKLTKSEKYTLRTAVEQNLFASDAAEELASSLAE